MIRIIALTVFLFLSFETADALVFTLASRFLVRLPVVTTRLSRIRNLGLPAGTQKVKFFIEKYGKQILMVATIGSLMDILEQEVPDPSLADYCYVPDVRNVWCYRYDYGSCGCHAGGDNPQRFFIVSCSYTNTGASGYIPGVRVALRSDINADIALIPSAGSFHFQEGPGTADITINLKVGPCPTSPSQEEDIPRPVDDVKVFPNPFDFFTPDVVNSSPALSQLNTIRDNILNDPSIPFVDPSVFDNLSSVDVIPLVDDTLELNDDITPTQDMIKDNPGTTQDDLSNVTFPDLDTSLTLPEKRSFPFELLQTVINSHPILRLLSSASISASGGSCTLSSSVFTLDFCPFSWVFQLMGIVIVFIATVAPFMYSRD